MGKGKPLLDATRFDQRKVNSPCRPRRAKSAQPDYLKNEIKSRIHHDSVKFKLLIQVADKGDDLDDPSIAWPDTRIQVELGILEITEVVSDNAAAERKLLFLPGALPPGIEP